MAAISDLQAIDVHAHFGVSRGEGSALKHRFMSGDAQTVAQRAQQANTRLTIVSPLRALMPRCQAGPVGGNAEAADAVARHRHLRQWAGSLERCAPGSLPRATCGPFHPARTAENRRRSEPGAKATGHIGPGPGLGALITSAS